MLNDDPINKSIARWCRWECVEVDPWWIRIFVHRTSIISEDEMVLRGFYPPFTTSSEWLSQAEKKLSSEATVKHIDNLRGPFVNAPFDKRLKSFLEVTGLDKYP